MYSGILKGMAGRSVSSKENKLQQKQGPSDPGLPIDEFLDLKRVLSALKESLLLFNKTIANSASYNIQVATKHIHDGLGDVLNTIKTIVDKYPVLSTPEVYASAHMLVCYIQSTSIRKISVKETDRLINQLALHFTKSVSQFVVQLKEAYDKGIKTQGIKETSSSNLIFGIELEKHLNANNLDLPFVVTKCIKEVEQHGLFVKGIYRVSAVKSKVNQLCEDFEKYGSKVNLTDINPNIIANVLKLYLRELPQPVFTLELYPEFISVAKLYASNSSEENTQRCIEELRNILAKLPKSYYTTAVAVMQHLHRISAQSTVNNMSAYNLAVIFGPTLLHCLRGNTESGSKAALYDNVHQIRAIELMITWTNFLFQND